MKTITKRRIGVAAGFGILLGSFFVSQLFSTLKTPPPTRPEAAPLPVVEVVTARPEAQSTSLEVQGSLVAFDKIDLFSEVSGTLEETSRPFKVGSYFPEGSVLIRIDDTEARLSLLSQKSNLLNAITQIMPDLKIDHPESFPAWEAYLQAFDLEQPIRPFPQPVNDQEKYFIASRNLHTQYYTIKSAEERLGKYVLSAPFAGVLTQTSINPGAVVRAGQKLGELMNNAAFELEATVPLSDLQYVRTGSAVTLFSDDVNGQWSGRVKRISDQVDPGSQTVKVFIGLNGPQLREGMYLRGKIDAGTIENAVSVPRNLLVDQKRLYVLRDTLLDLKEVEVVRYEGDQAIVKGLEEGAQYLIEKLPGAFAGMRVQAKNTEPTPAVSLNDGAVGSMLSNQK